MPALLASFFASKLGQAIRPFLPYLFVMLIAAGLVWWIADLRATIADQAATINTVQADLKAEKAARQRDIAGLTALSQGLGKVAVETKQDAKIVQETVKDANVPLSPQLGALLDGLRATSGKPADAAK
ncbi:hypothetical protein [Sphingomonas sp.]|uniref:hypothetical protein n=1 Tax=Sphingomonas sp. TaxID=28214 RepID=UPI003B3A30D6